MELMDILIIVMVTLAIVVVIIATIYIYNYNTHTHFQSAIKKYKSQYFDAWFDYLYIGVEQSPPFSEKYQRRATIEIFFAIERNGTTPQIQARISEFLSENLKSRYKKQLRSKYWAHRVNALNEIATFKIDGFTESFTDKQIEKFS